MFQTTNQKMMIVSQKETFDPLKTSPKFQKSCACHEKWPSKPPLVLTDACQRFSNLKKVLSLCHTDGKKKYVVLRHAKRRFRPRNTSGKTGLRDTWFVLHLDISQGIFFCAVRVIQNAAHVWSSHLKWTQPALLSSEAKICVATLFGEDHRIFVGKSMGYFFSYNGNTLG